METSALEDKGASRRKVWKVTQSRSDGKPTRSELYLSIWNSDRSVILSSKEVIWEAEQFIL